MSRFEKFLLAINAFFYIAFAIFSYSYVDLNLTLSQNEASLTFIKYMQQLGYYNRPAATTLYVLLIICTFSFFIISLRLFYKSKIGINFLRASTLVNTLVLILAYPFLSSDLFNYLFDAKIILNYGANPYTHRPLDFPNDEWLRFMRWVHRYSPYGPLWLGLSLIPAILGFGKLVLNLLAFKIFISAFHLINAVLIFKVVNKTKPKFALFGTAFYALNPVLLIEGVANSHNDVVLATFLIMPIYFMTLKKNWMSYLAIFFGTLIKYIPLLNLPWLIWQTFSRSKKVDNLILINLITMAVFTVVFSSIKISTPFISSGATQVQFQPWYLFWTLPLVAITGNYYLIAIFTALALGASLRYLPYLVYGDWSHPHTIVFMQVVTILAPIIMAAILFSRKYLKK